jgi:hypothetical protein
MHRLTHFENKLKENLCDKSQNDKIKSLLLGKKYSDEELLSSGDSLFLIELDAVVVSPDSFSDYE